MQSLERAIKRGNAIRYVSSPALGVQVCWKKGSTKKVWDFAVKNKI
jgi:hypothetical protein